jgi:hypothetical protein
LKTIVKKEEEMKIVLINEFHKTKTIALVKNNGTLSSKQVKRIERDLCGHSDCLCSKWNKVEDKYGNKLLTLGNYDGGCTIEIA